MALPKPRTGPVENLDENSCWNGRAKLPWTLRRRWEKTCFNDWRCFGVGFAPTMKHCWCCNAKKNLFLSDWARLQAVIQSVGCGGVFGHSGAICKMGSLYRRFIERFVAQTEGKRPEGWVGGLVLHRSTRARKLWVRKPLNVLRKTIR